jgi:ribonuclease-3
VSPPALARAGDARTAALEQRLGYRFVRRGLLEEALTQSSASGRGRRARRSNERLEFLGDRVVGLVVAHLLITRFPDEGEGGLSRRHAALVQRETLAEVAAELALGECLVLARSEEEGGGRANPAILADVLEAVLGAIYLDGGLAAAETLIRNHFRHRLAAMQAPPQDAKTALQEWAQGRGLALPSYEVVKVEGPAHAPHFEVVVTLADRPPARAAGRSKRVAERLAAAAMLAGLEPDHV